MNLQRLDIDHAATLRAGSQTDFINAVHDAMLLFARDVHHVEGEKLARDLGEGYVQVDFHALA